LDPLTQRIVLDLLRERREGGITVLFCSHVLGEVEGLCDRVALLRGGRLLRCSALHRFDELRRRRFELTLNSAEEAALACRRIDQTVLTSSVVGERLAGQTERVGALITALEGFDLDSLKLQTLRLEDLFYQLYDQDSSDRDANQLQGAP